MSDDADLGAAAGEAHGRPDRLVEALISLAADVAGDAVRADPEPLSAALTEAVSGFVGTRLTLVHTGHPVHLSMFVPDASSPGAVAVTSLRMPLPLISPAFEDGGRLVVWSTVAGSLVDLAADLGYVFRTTADPDDTGPQDAVVLDVDLPAPPAVSGLEGHAELAMIHRAAGWLIARGVDPDAAHVALRQDAAAAGLSTHAFAARLIAPGAPRRPGPEAP